MSALRVLVDDNLVLQYLTSPVLESVSITLDERYTPQMETIYSILISKLQGCEDPGFFWSNPDLVFKTKSGPVLKKMVRSVSGF